MKPSKTAWQSVMSDPAAAERVGVAVLAAADLHRARVVGLHVKVARRRLPLVVTGVAVDFDGSIRLTAG